MSSSRKKRPEEVDESGTVDHMTGPADNTSIPRIPDDTTHNFLHILGNQNDLMKTVMNAIGDPISIQDTSFRILYQNEAHKKFIGTHTGEICYHAYMNRDSICETCPVAMSFRDGLSHTIEKPGAPEKGITFVEITASPLLDSSSNIIAGIEVVRDLTARRKSEEAVRHAEEKFRSLVEHSLVGIYIYQDEKFQYVNPKAADIFGYDQKTITLLNLNVLLEEHDLMTAERNISQLLSGEATIIHSFLKGRRIDGSVIEIETQGTKTEINGKPAIIGTLIDITDRRKIDNEIQKIQKLESLSSFASGIAHEYNNILTAIIGNLALAKMYAKPGYEVYDVLNEAEKASLRAKDLTSQLLSFAKGGVPVKKVVFIKELLKDLISLFQDSRSISCEMSVLDNLWPVEVDEGQIGQAVNALIMHAQQATLQGGKIRITAENMVINQASSLPLQDGRYVVIVIEDNGGGISEQNLQTLFDPFTPGDLKSGSLGLASSFAIVQKHNGHITAESHFGKGTIFRVHLPAMQEQPHVAPESLASHTGRRKRILVMDDEEIVRVVINRLLLQCGFEAELSKDGNEMLRLYHEAKEGKNPFDLVILDLIIQDGMGGQEAMINLLSYDSSAKVIVSSGYSNDPIMTNFREYGFSGFLPKPYKLEELKRVLKEVFFSRQ